jgi:hypothetical protein
MHVVIPFNNEATSQPPASGCSRASTAWVWGLGDYRQNEPDLIRFWAMLLPRPPTPLHSASLAQVSVGRDKPLFVMYVVHCWISWATLGTVKPEVTVDPVHDAKKNEEKLESVPTAFWDITSCSPLKSTDVSEEHRLHLRGRWSSACHLLSRWFLARFILRPWRWRLCSSKTSV